MTKRVDAADEFKGLDRAFLIATIITLRARVAEMEAHGIRLRGWWCDAPCRAWNGEEHSERTHCRSCGTFKHAAPVCTGTDHV